MPFLAFFVVGLLLSGSIGVTVGLWANSFFAGMAAWSAGMLLTFLCSEIVSAIREGMYDE